MNGVTGRMGLNQHLRRSIGAIMKQGGIRISDAERIVPRPLLVGRSAAKLEAISREFGGLPYTTELDTALADPRVFHLFRCPDDGAAFRLRSAKPSPRASTFIARSPVAETLEKALAALPAGGSLAGIKHGVVQDKLWLPGLVKLQRLRDMGFFGRIISVRGEFGYWVFEGDTIPAQRPSWNYRKEDGGGIILDMFCHWRYVLDNLFGPVKAVSCRGATHIADRRDEDGKPYECTADDSAYATFELEGGILAPFNLVVVRARSPRRPADHFRWTAPKARPWQDCATAGFSRTAQRRVPVWDPDVPSALDYFAGWQKVPEQEVYENAFKRQWELFLRHVVKDEPFRWNLLEGAKGLQLAEKGMESWKKRAWVDIEPL